MANISVRNPLDAYESSWLIILYSLSLIWFNLALMTISAPLAKFMSLPSDYLFTVMLIIFRSLVNSCILQISYVSISPLKLIVIESESLCRNLASQSFSAISIKTNSSWLEPESFPLILRTSWQIRMQRNMLSELRLGRSGELPLGAVSWGRASGAYVGACSLSLLHTPISLNTSSFFVRVPVLSQKRY